MKCPEVRAALPAFVYDALPPAAAAAVEAHAAACPACGREAEALRRVRRLLAAAPAPEPPVDVAAVYRKAAELAARRARRWRRAALVAGAAVAATLLVGAFARLEVRADSRQLVVRWAAEPAPAAPPPPAVEPPAAANAADSDERLRLLEAIVQALADDARARDGNATAELARVKARLRDLEQTSSRRWTAMERDVDALYTAQFANRKGANP